MDDLTARMANIELQVVCQRDINQEMYQDILTIQESCILSVSTIRDHRKDVVREVRALLHQFKSVIEWQQRTQIYYVKLIISMFVIQVVLFILFICLK
jgi:sigma54-dependent transcription regulator